ncbi:MAG: tetratricopeptide repeat protein [Anaerolineae bacterium]|nr:tetratricopeptide repeat protein [Anaerolineae bacterium]
MRKVFLAALFLGIAAIMALGSGTKQAVAQRPTNTPSPTPYPAVTVVIGNFALTGTRGVNAAPSTVLNAITSLNLRTVNVVRTQAILNADAAQQAADRYDATMVIWGAPEGTAQNRHLVIHYDMLGRQALLDVDPMTRRRVTLTGIFGLPESAEVTAFAGLPAPALTAFTQAQLFLAITDDSRAKALLATADAESASAKPSVEADAVYVNWFRSEVAFYRAYLALREGSVDIALDRFQEVLGGEARPGINAWTNINAGALSIQRRRYDNAVSLLEQAITLDEGATLAYVNLGAAYWRQGNDNKALDTFDQAIELDSRNTYALNDRGYVLFQANQPDEALQNFRDVIDIDPNFIDAYINQALLYRTIGELDLSLRDINSAISLSNNRDSYPLVLRADIYYARGEYDLALLDLEAALKLDAENDYALTVRGDIYAKQGLDSAAINSYSLAITVTPTNPYPYLQRAQLYLKSAKYKEAILDATSALELGKSNPDAYVDAYYYRAESYSGLNRFPEAIADYQRYISQAADGKYASAAKARIASLRSFITPSPTVTRTRTNTPTVTPTRPASESTAIPVTATSTPSSEELSKIGDDLANQGRDGEALNAYGFAIQQYPGDAYSYMQRAKVYVKIFKYKEATLDATSALELGKDDLARYADAFFVRAEAAVGLNRFPEAVADYQAYLQNAPDGKYAAVAKARLVSIGVYVTPTRTDVPTSTATPIPPSATPTITLTSTPTTVPATATIAPTKK